MKDRNLKRKAPMLAQFSAQPSHQRGLSMIELMVAMALSLTLMAGVFQIFVGNKKSFEITRDLSDMQENGRMAMTFLGESLRMADHWAGLEGGDVNSTASFGTLPASDCDATWLVDTETAIEGFEGGTAAPTDIDGCISNYVPNSDVIVVRYADARELIDDAELAAGGDRVFVRLSLNGGGRIVNGNDSTQAIADIPQGTAVLNFPYAAELFFLRACSLENAGACVDDIPTLVRLSFNGNDYVQQPLIEGIEQVQYEYGVDTDADFLVDDYVQPAGVGDWGEVMSVRISVVARASNIDIAVNDTGTYTMAGGYDHTAPAGDNRFRRKLYNREIHIRNRSRL